LAEYLDYLRREKLFDRKAIADIKSVAVIMFKTLESEEKWGDVYIRTINIDDYAAKFRYLTQDKYTDGSHRAYKTKLKRAIGWYKNFLEDPDSPDRTPLIYKGKSIDPLTDTLISNGKVSGLVQYLSYLLEKDLVKRKVISRTRSAAVVMFKTVEGLEERWSDVDIISLDIDDYFAKFKELTSNKYAATNYKPHKALTERAIGWYMHFLQNPDWVPPTDEHGNLKPQYSICEECGRPRARGSVCTVNHIRVNGKEHRRIQVEDYNADYNDEEPDDFCIDCKAKRGKNHHFFCYVELCPSCGDFLVYCKCDIEFPNHVINKTQEYRPIKQKKHRS
jgi:hypothetical protein